MGSSLIARLQGSPTWARCPLRPLLPRPPAPQLLPILLPFCRATPAAPAALPPPGSRPEPRSFQAPLASLSSPGPSLKILRHLKTRGVCVLGDPTTKAGGGPTKPHPREGRWPAAVRMTAGTSCGLQNRPGGQHSGRPFRAWDSNLSIPEPLLISERDRGSRGCKGASRSGPRSPRRAAEQKATLHSAVSVLERGHNCPALLGA